MPSRTFAAATLALSLINGAASAADIRVICAGGITRRGRTRQGAALWSVAAAQPCVMIGKETAA